MREIKFRAWKQSESRMIEWHELVHDGHFGAVMQGVYLEPMQFTGLRDKNGREIYEGDILQSAYEGEEPEEHERGVVEYGRFNCSCCGGVYGWSISNDKADLRNVGPDSDPSLEVIGNIYETPELLPVGK